MSAPVDLALGERAPDCVFLSEADREVRLSDLWFEAPLVLVFLRHFG
ncbi:MAG: hypothetical protein QF642_07785 [Myxococcota bacterium]|nr:hypothetical protein [Myxococcota bacterium]